MFYTFLNKIQQRQTKPDRTSTPLSSRITQHVSPLEIMLQHINYIEIKTPYNRQHYKCSALQKWCSLHSKPFITLPCEHLALHSIANIMHYMVIQTTCTLQLSYINWHWKFPELQSTVMQSHALQSPASLNRI